MLTERNNGRNNQPDKMCQCQSTTSSPNKQDSRRGRARTVGGNHSPLLALSKLPCHVLVWEQGGVASPHTCLAWLLWALCLRVRLSCATSRQEKADGRHKSFLSACGHKTTRERHHGTSTNDTVVTSRYSTVHYQTSPTKTDGVSESVQCVHKRALGDTKSVLAQRSSPRELASDLER